MGHARACAGEGGGWTMAARVQVCTVAVSGSTTSGGGFSLAPNKSSVLSTGVATGAVTRVAELAPQPMARFTVGQRQCRAVAGPSWSTNLGWQDWQR